MIKAIAQSGQEASDRRYLPPYQETITMMAQLEQYLQSENSDTSTLSQTSAQSLPQREPIKHLLIGSPQAVTSTIRYLQVIGYASVGDWSPLLPTANAGEVMSILIRQILM